MTEPSISLGKKRHILEWLKGKISAAGYQAVEVFVADNPDREEFTVTITAFATTVWSRLDCIWHEDYPNLKVTGVGLSDNGEEMIITSTMHEITERRLVE